MSRAARPSNIELRDAFRALLTEGCPEELREATRAWRALLWRAFAPIDARLCPVPPPEPEKDQDDDGSA